ncbi:acyl-homoserine-lactone synthase (plasmid) [Pelagibacterium nitratireducens]|uniref:Acyl-homoserine-lactone synthase n=1 Tax=Pelagibacterium nitratireducens TaxID=1046114 RepID=A0ABZ2IBG1_9HYPH|tara:strand:- start:7217 stop:7846 length:630 start_codon:yes stop_codon:yes gene_type:complete
MQAFAIRGTTSDTNERALLTQMHVLRTRVFKDRLGWDVKVRNGQEFDEYDALNPIYLVLCDGRSQVIGCARLLPSTGPTMLAGTFRFLLGDSPVPKSRTIVESSRFCVETSSSTATSASGLREATLALLAGVIELARSNGFDQIVTVTDTRFERVLKRAAWPLERLSPPHPVGNTIAVAGTLMADLASFNRVKPDSYRGLLPSAKEIAA